MEEVRREEMKEVWDTTRNVMDQFKITFEKPYKYSLWITNVSLGLLGFYIAFLLQIKSKEPLTNKVQVLTTLAIIIIPIAIGVFYRFKFEVIDIYNSLKKFLNQIKTFLETADEKLVAKGLTPTEKKDIEKIKFSWEFMEKWSKRPVFYGIIIQFLFFIMGLINVIVYLLKYLLF